MRQDDAVGLGVRQVERAAERVTELVVNRHPDGAERCPAKPCPV